MASIYKYFGNLNHLESFVGHGEVYFNSLSYFLTCEDTTRRDATEDATCFRPADGLEITNLRTDDTFRDSRYLISRINKPHRIFVFCTSLEHSGFLFNKFNSAGCVEILDIGELKKRTIKAMLNPLRSIKNKRLLAGPVDYYNYTASPGTRHACPDQIIMSKPNLFEEEKEFRLAFALDLNAFDVNNVKYLLAHQLDAQSNVHSSKALKLGNLSDICKVWTHQT